jgi:hypothetical protein
MKKLIQNSFAYIGAILALLILNTIACPAQDISEASLENCDDSDVGSILELMKSEKLMIEVEHSSDNSGQCGTGGGGFGGH